MRSLVHGQPFENLNALRRSQGRAALPTTSGSDDRADRPRARVFLSSKKISRLLTHARQAGLIGNPVHDPEAQPRGTGAEIQDRFHIAAVRVVMVPLNSYRGRMAEICGGLRRKTYQ